MFQDLLREFTRHREQYPEFDMETMVTDHYRLKPGLYIRLGKEGGFDELYITPKSVLAETDPVVEWFKRADLYSDLVAMNKSIDKKKQIHSNNMFTVFCKLKTLWQDGKLHPQLKAHLQRYFSAFTEIKKDEMKILEKAGYQPLTEQEVESHQRLIFAGLDLVGERIRKHEIEKNCYIKVFLAKDLESYVYEGRRYLLRKIFNCNDYNVLHDGQIFGLSSADMGMNAKKPFLEHKTTAFKVPFRITLEEALQLHWFYFWLNGQKREKWFLFSGYMPAGEHRPQLLAQAHEVEVRSTALYVRWQRGKKLAIVDYDVLPSFNDRLDKPVTFYNYVQSPSYQGGRQDRLSGVEAHINEYLYGYQLVGNYDAEKIQVTNRLPKALAVQIILSRGAMQAWLRKGNSLPIRHCLPQVTKGVIRARLHNLEYISTLAQMLNVHFSLLKYFGEGEEDMGNIMKEAYEALRGKILEEGPEDEIVVCTTNREFYLTLGQLLYYYLSLSEAEKIAYDFLWRNIASSANLNDIKKEHDKFFRRYSPKIGIYSPRFKKMLSIISSWQPETEMPVDLEALFFGFVTPSIIYFKEEGETKNEKK